MLSVDKTALICDLAETYHVLDWRSLPLLTVAALASGLRETARIRQKISATRYTTGEILTATAVDYLALLWWAQTEDGQKGRRRPESILNKLLGTEPEKKVTAFATGEEFEKRYAEITGGSHERN